MGIIEVQADISAEWLMMKAFCARKQSQVSCYFQYNAKTNVLMVIVNPMKTQSEGCESLTPEGKLSFSVYKIAPSCNNTES